MEAKGKCIKAIVTIYERLTSIIMSSSYYDELTEERVGETKVKAIRCVRLSILKSRGYIDSVSRKRDTA